jgi:hypothetical protein
MEEVFFYEDLPPLINDNDDSLFFTEPIEELNDSIFWTESYQGPAFLETNESKSPSQPTFTKTALARKNRKDDFDYDTYIRGELAKHGAESLDDSVKKKMIQKIRNRMSAQRSRLRQKGTMSLLEQENQELKEHNTLLIQQIIALQHENKELKETVKKLETAKKTPSLSETDETSSNVSSQKGSRIRVNTGSTFNKGLILLAIAALACILLPQSGSQPGPVKMSGVVPFIGNRINAGLTTQLTTIEDQCRKYCPTCNETPFKEKSVKSVQLYQEEHRRIQPYKDPSLNTLVCFDPMSGSKVQDVFKVLVDSQTRSTLQPNEFYLAEFQKVHS